MAKGIEDAEKRARALREIAKEMARAGRSEWRIANGEYQNGSKRECVLKLLMPLALANVRASVQGCRGAQR